MMMFWISCLLIGSATCVPLKGAAPQVAPHGLPDWGRWFNFGAGGGSHNPSSVETGAPYDAWSAGPGSYPNSYAAQGFRDEGYSGPGVSAASGYDGGFAGYGYGYDAEGVQGGDLEDGGAEPVFSDVSDLEPVYSYSSRSSYERGRAVLSQTRYVPEEPAPPPPMLVSEPINVNPPKGSAPAKGGY